MPRADSGISIHISLIGSIIKEGIKENGGEDAIKIVKSVLDARHKSEMAELEDKFGIQREQLLLECSEEDRIKVIISTYSVIIFTVCRGG